MPAPPAVEVCSDPAQVGPLVIAGRDVILVVAPGSPGAPPGLAASLWRGPGRVAVLVADPSDPASHEMATEMGAEVFGRPDVRPG